MVFKRILSQKMDSIDSEMGNPSRLPLSFNGHGQFYNREYRTTTSHFILTATKKFQIANSKRQLSHFLFNGHK
ncbi:MAG: hypothetical protein DRR19_32860 [Candidatus Parabeggiatoa sp. nov. 1]|nr:MAG: hypothetical protein DRR19_32860 [Gammaproteobacteria bacterium]